jgi:hypothetical protein
MPINQTSVWNGSQWVTMGGVVDTASNYNWAGSHNFAQSAIFQDDVRVRSLNGGQLAGFRNKIINGGFDVWQRGTSFTFNSSGGYTADRFNMSSGTGGVAVISRQTFTPGQTDVPGNPKYYMQIQHTTDGGTPANLDTRIEDVNTFSGQNATFSFYGKVSSGTAVWTPRLVQFFGTGGSAVNVVMASDITLTTSWQRFTVTFAVPSTAGKTIGEGNYLRPDIYRGTTGTVTYHFANVQFEAGTVATPFEYRPIGTELALCQRYYYRMSAGKSYSMFGLCSSANTTNGNATIKLPVTMRVVPTSVDSSAANTFFLQQGSAGAAYILTSPPSYNSAIGSTDLGGIDLAVGSGLTANTFYGIYSNNNTSAYIGFSAEL